MQQGGLPAGGGLSQIPKPEKISVGQEEETKDKGQGSACEVWHGCSEKSESQYDKRYHR